MKRWMPLAGALGAAAVGARRGQRAADPMDFWKRMQASRPAGAPRPRVAPPSRPSRPQPAYVAPASNLPRFGTALRSLGVAFDDGTARLQSAQAELVDSMYEDIGIAWIQAKRGSGAGTELLKRIIQASEATCLPLRLEVDDENSGRLYDWYKRFGFRPSDDDFDPFDDDTAGAEMERYPQARRCAGLW